MGTPNREPEEYSRNIIEDEGPGSYIPIMFLLYSWGSLFGVPIKVPLIVVYTQYAQFARRQKKGRLADLGTGSLRPNHEPKTYMGLSQN